MYIFFFMWQVIEIHRSKVNGFLQLTTDGLMVGQD